MEDPKMTDAEIRDIMILNSILYYCLGQTLCLLGAQ